MEGEEEVRAGKCEQRRPPDIRVTDPYSKPSISLPLLTILLHAPGALHPEPHRSTPCSIPVPRQVVRAPPPIHAHQCTGTWLERVVRRVKEGLEEGGGAHLLCEWRAKTQQGTYPGGLQHISAARPKS